MVSTHMTTTPAATRRAETSLTGLGNEKRVRTRLDVLEGVLSTAMTCSFLKSLNPDQFSRVSRGKDRRAGRHRWAHAGPAGQVSGSGTGWGGGAPT